MILFENVTLTYGNQKPIVYGDFQIHQGECVVVCGPSGSGKSSFLQLLNGLVPDYHVGELTGRASVNDFQLGEQSIEDLAKEVTTVFQQASGQFFNKHVIDELVFPCENLGLPREEIQERLMQVVKQFDLEKLLKKEVKDLSGGQQQRLALALAKMQDTPIILLDEPTANLDDYGVRIVRDYIRNELENGKTIIIAEHRLDYLQEFATNYFYLNHHQLKIISLEEWHSLSEKDILQLGLRFNEPDKLEIPKLAQSSSIMEINNSPYGQLHFPDNQIIAITGSNGIGKSYLARTIAGLEKNQWEVIWQGQALKRSKRNNKTTLVMQDVRKQLFMPTVRDEITLGNRYSSDLEATCAPLGLVPYMSQHPLTLSGGQQQRVIIASSLIADKAIYIFDEPSSGLDYHYMLELAELLKRLKKEGHLVLVISHDKQLINRACDTYIKLGQ